MKKETNEDARTKQDLLYECVSLNSKLSNEIVKNEQLQKKNKQLKKVIDKVAKYIDCINGGKICSEFNPYLDDLLDILKEASE